MRVILLTVALLMINPGHVEANKFLDDLAKMPPCYQYVGARPPGTTHWTEQMVGFYTEHVSQKFVDTHSRLEIMMTLKTRLLNQLDSFGKMSKREHKRDICIISNVRFDDFDPKPGEGYSMSILADVMSADYIK